ncbi:MAG: GNAT family N-acetyltransferase [Comamonadaceae bacterium]|nr:GNAT family N-acetyltransferase [Comamonadaceae bacterium]
MLVRDASLSDLDAVVEVHLRAFEGFFLTNLGSSFLRELYRGFICDKRGIIIVAEDGDQGIVGFAAGTDFPETFFRNLRNRRAPYFIVYSVPAMLRHPIMVAKKLCSAISYRGDEPDAIDGGVLLSSIGVLPNVRGRSCGRLLLEQFEGRAISRSAQFVYLMTDGLNNEKVRCFYEGAGYVVESERVRGDQRLMIRYVKKLRRIGTCDGN